MKIKLCIWVVLFAMATAWAQTNNLTTLLQQGLFEEQANRNLDAAIENYTVLARQFDKDRQIAATAVFRLGECYRAQGKINEAAVQYQRILRDFADQKTLATLSQQNLAGMGAQAETSATNARQQQKELLNKQIALAEQDLVETQKLVQVGKAAPADTRAAEREVLRLKQQLAALDAGKVDLLTVSAPTTNEEDQEIARIKQMIQNSPDLINAPEPGANGQIPLVKAASQGWSRVVQFLLDNGAQMNNSALFSATSVGQKTMVELLLERGAEVNARNSDKATPLHQAAEKGYVALAEVLIQRKADLEARRTDRNSYGFRSSVAVTSLAASPRDGQTPLHCAVIYRKPAIVALLLAKGADINAADKAGLTPVTMATLNDDLSTLNQLIKAGAKLDAADATGTTALGYAAQRGSLECVKALLAAKASPASGKGNSTLSAAIQNPEILKLLLDAGPNPNIRTNYLLLFAALDKPAALKLLLDAGVNPNPSLDYPSINYATANPEALKLLLAAGADPKTKGALVKAIYEGQAESTAMLIQAGADVNAPGMNDMTPLMMAVWKQNLPIVSMLLTNKVDINARHSSRLTALGMSKYAEGGSRPNEAGKYGNGVSTSSDRDLARKISDLLRQHGALDKLPEWDRIVVTRPDWSYSEELASKGTNDWNHFTLLELLYMSKWRKDQLKFPDLANVVIVRPTTNGTEFRRMAVNLLNATNGLDCSRDVPLEFGDIVEIPEREHSLVEKDVYLTSEQDWAILNYFRGQKNEAKLIVGNDKPLVLPLQPFFSVIGEVLSRAPALNALTSNSDFSRVKVTRQNPKTKNSETWVLDCRDQSNRYQPWFWLRNGDVIEVPLKK